MAHAWVEVYLEGFGWYIMEATPTYAFLMNPARPLGGGGGGASGDWIDHELEAMMRYWLYGTEYEDMYRDFFANQPTTTAAPILVEEEEYEREPWLTSFMFFLLTGLFFALIIAALITIRRLHTRAKFKRLRALSPNEKVKIYYRAIMDIVTYYTTPLTPAETPKAYGQHMGRRFAFHSDSVFLRDIIDLYYKAKYSSATISDDELSLMHDAHTDMMDLLRSMRHKFVFFYLKHIKRVGELKE
jgi:hypothetical protein